MEAAINAFLELISYIYENAPLSVRFVYGFWVLLAFLYFFMGKYEKMHKLIPKRTKVNLNYPYAVLLPGLVSLILYNVGIYMNDLKIISNTRYRGIFVVIGFIFLFYGLLVATWGRISLNGKWGSNIYKYYNGELVDYYAYRYMRHPIYSGQIAMSIGSFLIVFSWWIIIFPIGVIFFDIIRAIKEEKDLEKRFPDKFESYKGKTLSFIPWKGK